MLASLGDRIRGVTKKAIGYVRGLNGNKAAAFLNASIGGMYPSAGVLLSPYISKLGSYVNERVDDYLSSTMQPKSGVQKPRRMRPLPRITNPNALPPDIAVRNLELNGGMDRMYPQIEAVKTLYDEQQ